MKKTQLILPLTLSVLFLCTSAQQSNVTELRIAFITSFEGDYDSSVAVPAARLAAEKINENENVLFGTRLVVELVENRAVAEEYANSKCNGIDSQRTFLEQITSGEEKIALIGCGCSLATEPVAVSSNFWNITHISYTPTSSVLSNRTLFPNVWSMFPPASAITSPILALLRQYNWNKVKIITQGEGLFQESSDDLVRELTAANITVDTSGTTVFFTQSNVFNLTESELFPDEVRVYFLNMYPTHARRIMCRAAYNHRTSPNPEHHYPGYVWITLGWYQDDWWRGGVANDDTIHCTSEDLEPFIRRTLSVQIGNSSVSSTSQTDVGLTAAEFETEILRLQMADGQASGFSTVAYTAYDAVWSLAIAINSSLPNFAPGELQGFDYRTGRNITSVISEGFSDILFTGVSGPVQFDTNGTRVPGLAKILKYGNSSTRNACNQRTVPEDVQRRYLVATDNANSTFVYADCENDSSTWPDGVPSDGTPIVILTTFFTPLYIVYNIAVILGIGFAVVCLLFNCIFRNRQIVRLISPNLNYIIILGAIFLYISVTFFVFPTTDPFWTTFACHFRIWLQTLGYFMCFGTIVAKMLRIYLIFYRGRVEITSSRQMAVKDWHLVLIVVAMCSVVVVIGIAVAIFGDYKAVQVPDRERPITRNEDNVLFEKHNLVCQGPRDLIWIVILYLYILATQLIAVFLAIRTRKVEIKILNDAKYIVIIIYLTSVIITIMIVCAVLLSNFLNADGAVFGGLIYIFITTVLAVLFIPKMVILYRDPHGRKIMKGTNVQASQDDTAVTFAANKDAVGFDRRKDVNHVGGEEDDVITNIDEAVDSDKGRKEGTEVKEKEDLNADREKRDSVENKEESIEKLSNGGSKQEREDKEIDENFSDSIPVLEEA